MLAAPEIAWETFVLVISFSQGWLGWEGGEGALEQHGAAGTTKLAQGLRLSPCSLPCVPFSHYKQRHQSMKTNYS